MVHMRDIQNIRDQADSTDIAVLLSQNSRNKHPKDLTPITLSRLTPASALCLFSARTASKSKHSATKQSKAQPSIAPYSKAKHDKTEQSIAQCRLAKQSKA